MRRPMQARMVWFGGSRSCRSTENHAFPSSSSLQDGVKAGFCKLIRQKVIFKPVSSLQVTFRMRGRELSRTMSFRGRVVEFLWRVHVSKEEPVQERVQTLHRGGEFQWKSKEKMLHEVTRHVGADGGGDLRGKVGKAGRAGSLLGPDHTHQVGLAHRDRKHVEEGANTVQGRGQTERRHQNHPEQEHGRDRARDHDRSDRSEGKRNSAGGEIGDGEMKLTMKKTRARSAEPTPK